MLSNIQTSPKPSSDSEDAISLLLGCHQRIRHFTEVALRLARNPEAPASDRADAARSVLRYFQVALPLHEADENESIYPRLRRKLRPGALAEANEAMVRQHTEIDAVIAELIPQWQSVAASSSPSPELLSITRHLQELWDAHLSLEEEHVVPALRQHLTADDLKSIRDEMSARRQS
jgi:hemerythrin-like domain-containing protein